jgi:DNA polymerase III sliding clamp (beta) subunit (PCNA family)
MIVHKSAKVEKAASKDSTRPVLQHLYLRAGKDAGEGTLEATDSYMLVRVPVTMEDGDTEGFLPASALTEARKAADRYTSEVHVGANGSIEYGTKDGGTVTLARPEPGKFPDTAQLFPGELSTFEVGVNPKLLLAAAEAMGCETIRLSFARKRESSIECDSDPLRPITVRPLNGTTSPDAVAIVMPIRIAG